MLRVRVRCAEQGPTPFPVYFQQLEIAHSALVLIGPTGEMQSRLGGPPDRAIILRFRVNRGIWLAGGHGGCGGWPCVTAGEGEGGATLSHTATAARAWLPGCAVRLPPARIGRDVLANHLDRISYLGIVERVVDQLRDIAGGPTMRPDQVGVAGGRLLIQTQSLDQELRIVLNLIERYLLLLQKLLRWAMTGGGRGWLIYMFWFCTFWLCMICF
jgi:hypothetical protein